MRHLCYVTILLADVISAEKFERHHKDGEDLIERHHKDGDRTNNKRSNLELLHGHCHDAVHRQRQAADNP